MTEGSIEEARRKADEARSEIFRAGYLRSVAVDTYGAAEREVGRIEAEARYAALVPVLKRAKAIWDSGAEMMGPDPYVFTRDEVDYIMCEAVCAALAALEEARNA